MGTKSPTTSVKSREMIGVDAFSQRREVFDKHATVFMPSSPTGMVPTYRDADPIVTSNHGKTTSNFKRNTTGSSSFRDTRMDERNYDFRPRKYSDNFTSELNQSDDIDYRYSAIERTRRLSRMRREFLTSNLHEPTEDKPFTRSGTRASLPTGRTTMLKYKFESPNLFKFPFAEPYATPPPVRRVTIDASNEIDGKENEDPELRPKHQSIPSNSPTKVDHQKLFEELVKRYSPQRKPIDWTLPPTKPRVVASVPKSTSSAADSIDAVEKDAVQKVDENNKSGDDDVFENKENCIANGVTDEKKEVSEPKRETVQNGPENLAAQADVKDAEKDDRSSEESKISLSELEDKNDRVTELSIIQRQISRESAHKKPITIEQTDISIPALIDKITEEGDKLETNTKGAKKVKRKRSFLDKLLGRKKDK
ncbi:unnamed protein product [Diatraea saccharalis]|uniref:Uncharacterized protein n=1 Tax=Diatraea saccharalis TaxID=40085 RepID=A0A9N9RBL9_9NEOP|nr:unnamed protein product [Diatraea saccharalis]